ncbi:MAG TPA: hypothetical protein VLV30_00600 [Methanomicrobiales archaeon]|nr:hypothetical protein [Methanomicrobiales archaeon]
MFRFLKGLGKTGKTPQVLGIDDIPPWIAAREEEVRSELSDKVAGPRSTVLAALEEIERVLAGFGTGPDGEVPYRKLAGVTEHSLPLFVKAMRTSISRPLPEDPEGFYAAAGEILKGCLLAFRGQGRYLATRFPEEMRLLRDGVDTVGRELNALTPAISRSRERLGGLGGLRESHAAYLAAMRRRVELEQEIRSLETRETGDRSSLEGARHSLADLEGSEEYQAGERELSRIARLEEDRDGALRGYHAAAATAVHLLRKGEKVASRNRDREAVRVLQAAVALLERELPPATDDEDEAAAALASARGVLASLASSGDLALKSRAETDLLEVPGLFAREIRENSRRYRELAAGISSAREAAGSRPALLKSRALKKEIGELEKQVAGTVERLGQAREEAAGLDARIGASLEDLRQKIGALSGNTVQVGGTGGAEKSDKR